MGQPGNLREQLVPRLLSGDSGARGCDRPGASGPGWRRSDLSARYQSMVHLGFDLHRSAGRSAASAGAGATGAMPGRGDSIPGNSDDLALANWPFRAGRRSARRDYRESSDAPVCACSASNFCRAAASPIASQIRAVRDVLRLSPNSADANRWLENLQRREQEFVSPPPVMMGAIGNVVLASR